MVAFWEVYQKAILPMAGVKPGGKQEMLSIPFQQTARYVKYYGNDVSTEEEKVIRKVLDYDTIGKNYDPDLSDPVKNTYKQKDEYLKDYFNIWFEMLKKHPTAYIQATFKWDIWILGLYDRNKISIWILCTARKYGYISKRI